jgi:hypothetical protein
MTARIEDQLMTAEYGRARDRYRAVQGALGGRWLAHGDRVGAPAVPWSAEDSQPDVRWPAEVVGGHARRPDRCCADRCGAGGLAAPPIHRITGLSHISSVLNDLECESLSAAMSFAE